MKLYLVGYRFPNAPEIQWEFCGIFSLEEKAVAACITINHFIGPVELDADAITEQGVDWPGAWFPMAAT